MRVTESVAGVLGALEGVQFGRRVRPARPHGGHPPPSGGVAEEGGLSPTRPLRSPEWSHVCNSRSGGVRKLRWTLPGRGKRGGIRVIYFLPPEQGVIWMLTLYPKSVADNIPAHVLKQIREEIEDA